MNPTVLTALVGVMGVGLGMEFGSAFHEGGDKRGLAQFTTGVVIIVGAVVAIEIGTLTS